MSKTCVNCVLKFQLFFLNLSGKILADLDLELQLFNVFEFSGLGFKPHDWLKVTAI